MYIIHAIASKVITRHVSRIQAVVEDPVQAQENTFRSLIQAGRDTDWGKQYDYASVQRIEDLKARFPVQDYDTLKPWIDRILQGEQKVLWNTPISWFAKSSGTTSDKSKFIPVSTMSLEECHFKGGKDVLAMYLHNNPESRLFSGKTLLMGGSHQINQLNQHSKYGDVSAVMMQNLPWTAKYAMTPSLDIALMDEWESKIEAMALHTLDKDVTSIAGVPTWTIVLIRRLFEKRGVADLKDVWPNLELYIHGGVSFKPYQEQFNQLIQKEPMYYVETYNASEGFFAFQDRLRSDEMLLMPDYGLYYEFIPIEEFDKPDPKTLTWAQVELNKQYAVVISSNAGLWRYKIGDTIRFTSLFPHRVQVSGRVKHFINAFGEEVIVDNSDKAIAEACAQTGAKVTEYTAAPIYIVGNEKGGHEWIIEFTKAPDNLERFVHVLDNTLKAINSDYEAKRHKDLALKLPVVHVARSGAFYDWLRSKGKLGGQHKIPRLSNDRTYLEDIMRFL